MEPNRITVYSATSTSETPACALDPQLIDALRAALAAIAREQAPPASPAPAEDKGGKKKRGLVAELWQMTSALLVIAGSVAFVVFYLRLTNEFAECRSDFGKVRRELGLVRNELVRKEEFNGRSLAANTLIREEEAKSKATADSAAQRLEEQTQKLADLSQQFKELRRDAELLQERISAREKKGRGPGRRGGTERPSSGP
jgi:hypothetical protein